MTDKANLKKECIIHIRSILLSSPAALTIDEFKRDYSQFVGDPIPFRKIGYLTLEDFLTEISDVVYISWKKGVMCLEAVADASTAHIQSLVSKQKIPNAKKYATLRRGGPPPQRHRSGPPRPLPTVPAFIRKQLSILFKSYPGGLPFTHFEPAFSRRFNCQLQYARLGFTSMRELLQSVPDIVKLQDFGGEVRVVPGSSVSQNKSAPYIENADFEKRQQVRNLPPRLQKKYDEANSNRQRENEPQKPESSSKKNIPSQLQEEKPTAPRGRGKKISSSGSTDGRQRQRNTSGTSSNSLCSVGSSPGSPEQDSVINSRLADEICKLVQSKDRGIWVTQLQSVYQSYYVKTLNPLDHGYNSMIELCSALPDSIRLERPRQTGDWLLTDSSRPPVCLESNDSKEMLSKGQRQSNKQCTDPVVRETVRQVLQCKPSGVMLQELPQLYEELTGEVLPWERLGHGSMESFALSLADTVLQFEYKGNDQILLYAISTNQPPKTDLLKYAPSQVPNPKIVSKDSDIPEDAIGPGTFYHQQEFPPCQKYIEVYVSNVISPGLFWFQMRGKKTSLALEKVMNNLEATYASPGGNRYRIPEEMISVGLLVAAIFPEDGNWHRCVITSVKCTQYVDTYFVDYGNTCQVHRSNLRLLRSKYLRLPGQALQARLANIQPVGEKWTINARTRLLQLVTNRPLIALGTYQRDNLLSLCLTDTSESEDIHINDVLLHEGYARFQPDNYETDFYNYIEPNQIPDYSNVYGITDTSSSQSQITQNTTYQAGSTTETLAHSDNSLYRHYVLQLHLTAKHIVHLINLDGVGYLPSHDVSSFFWDSDILGSMIQRSDLDIQCVKVSLLEQPALFDELQKYDIGWWDKTQEADLRLYEINSLPVILEEFGLGSLSYESELNTNILQLIETFDPDDPYWKGEVSLEQSDEVQSDHLEDLPADDMQLMLQTMQFRRKRILQLMLSGETSDKHVDDLQSIDKMIDKLKERIKRIQKSQGRYYDKLKERIQRIQKSQEESAGIKTDAKAARFEDTDSAALFSNVATVSPTKQKPIATVASMQSTNIGAPLPSIQTQFINNQSAMNPASLLGMNFNQSDSSNLLGLNQSGLLLDPATAMNLSQSAMTAESAANPINLSQMNLAYQNLLLSQAVLSSQPTPSTSTNSGFNPDLFNLMQASLINPLLTPGLAGSMSGVEDSNPKPQGLGRGQNLRMASPLNVRAPTPPIPASQSAPNFNLDTVQGSQNTGTPVNATNLGILPGLMPLFQRMTLGGTSINKDQK